LLHAAERAAQKRFIYFFDCASEQEIAMNIRYRVILTPCERAAPRRRGWLARRDPVAPLSEY
jgi:hypothetical protein